MARVKGNVISTTYDVGLRRPLDAKMLVTAKKDLIDPAVWTPTGMSSQMCYNGMITAVANDGVYYLVDRTAITEENFAEYQSAVSAGSDVTPHFSMWSKLGELNDIDSLKDRVADLENELDKPVDTGISEEELNASIDALRTEISNANYATVEELGSYATDEELSSVLSEAKTYVDESLNDYVDAEMFSSEISKLITDEELADAIAAIPEADLTDYAKMSDLPDVSGKLDVDTYETEKVNFLTSIPEEYVTSTELAAEGFLKEHQDLSGYALKTDLPSTEGFATIDDVNAQMSTKANSATTLGGYGITDAYTRTEVDQKLTELASGGSINLEGYVSEDEWNSRVVDFATTADVDNISAQISGVQNSITTKADTSYVNDQLAATNASVASIQEAITYGSF